MDLLPRALCRLNTRLEGTRIVPRFLVERDRPWLAVLLEEHARFVGRKRSELVERMRTPLSIHAPRTKLLPAAHVLNALGRDRVVSAVAPREARWRVFRAASAAARERARDAVLWEVAEVLGVSISDLDGSLFADLHGERRVATLPQDFSPARLALATNLAIVCSIIRRAARVRISARGNTNALIRQTRRAGLICHVRQSEERLDSSGAKPTDTDSDAFRRRVDDAVVLEISGPFTLFRRTAVYGRALAALVPRAACCTSYELHADCAMGAGNELSTLIVRSGDPIPPAPESAARESHAEKLFVRDFQRATADWDVIREPCPIEAAGSLIFPDFELVHRKNTKRRWLLEIVGFWTAQSLAEKLRCLRRAALERIVLCVDERRRCSDDEFPAQARVIRYRRKIDARAVLAVIDDDKG